MLGVMPESSMNHHDSGGTSLTDLEVSEWKYHLKPADGSEILHLICVSSRRLVQDFCPYIGFIFISSNNPQPQNFRTWLRSWVLHPFLSQLGGLDFFYNENVLLKVTVVDLSRFLNLDIWVCVAFFWSPQTLIYDIYEYVKMSKTILSNYSILK